MFVDVNEQLKQEQRKVESLEAEIADLTSKVNYLSLLVTGEMFESEETSDEQVSRED